MYRTPHQRLVDSCEQIGRPISEIKLIAEFDAYFPADQADFPEPQWSGYLDFMASPLGPTPAQAQAEIMRLVEIGVEEFCVFFYDLATLRRFVDEVIPQFS